MHARFVDNCGARPDLAPRNRLILACMIAAKRVMRLVAAPESTYLRPLTDAFDADEQALPESLRAGLWWLDHGSTP